MAVKIAYYPGNTARAASSEVEDCIQPLCKTLGIQLIELPKASSDGGNIIKQSSPKLQHALVARNLALAETKGVDVMTTCATSYGIMCDTVDEFSSDVGFANTVNNIVARTTGIEFQGESQPRHLLHFLVKKSASIQFGMLSSILYGSMSHPTTGQTCSAGEQLPAMTPSCRPTWNNSSLRLGEFPLTMTQSVKASVLQPF